MFPCPKNTIPRTAVALLQSKKTLKLCKDLMIWPWEENKYCTRAIISRVCIFFTHFLKTIFCFQGCFLRKLCPQQFLTKSELWWRVYGSQKIVYLVSLKMSASIFSMWLFFTQNCNFFFSGSRELRNSVFVQKFYLMGSTFIHSDDF